MKNEGTGNRDQVSGLRGGNEMESLLRTAVPPLGDADQSGRDLWPAMRRRIEQEALPRRQAVPWFDWALAAAIVILLSLSPDLIPVLLYHL